MAASTDPSHTPSSSTSAATTDATTSATPRRTSRRLPTTPAPPVTSATAAAAAAAAVASVESSISTTPASASKRAAAATRTTTPARGRAAASTAAKQSVEDDDRDKIDLLTPTATSATAKGKRKATATARAPASASPAKPAASRAKPKAAATAATAATTTSTSTSATDQAPLATATTGSDPQVVIPVRKRGRPRKYADGEIPPWKQPKHFNPDGTPRGRGRPRKPKPIVTTPPRRGRPPKNKDGAAASKPKAVKKRDPGAQDDADADDADALYGDLLSSYLGGGADEDGEGASPKKKQKAEPKDETAEDVNDAHRIAGTDAAASTASLVSASGTSASFDAAIAASAAPRQPTVSSSAYATTSAIPPPGPPSASADGKVSESAVSEASKGRPAAAEASASALPSRNVASTPAAAAMASPASRDVHGGSGSGGQGSKLLRPTTSDAYFLYNSSRKTRGSNALSTNLISAILPPLEPSKLEAAVARMTRSGSVADRAVRAYRKNMVAVYEAQLKVGYSILFHGVGSKVPVLVDFMKRKGEQGDGVGVVVQGSMRGLRVEDILSEVERATGIGSIKDGRTAAAAAASLPLRRRLDAASNDNEDNEEEGDTVFGGTTISSARAKANAASAAQLASSALISRAQRVASFFLGDVPKGDGDDADEAMDVDDDDDDDGDHDNDDDSDPDHDGDRHGDGSRALPPRLYLLLLSFDAPALQAARFRPVLEAFAAADRIHVMACVEHVNAALVGGLSSTSLSFPSSVSSTGKGLYESGTTNTVLTSGDGARGGCRPRWLWQNLSTFVPPLDEMLLARTGARGGGVSAGGMMIALPPAVDLNGGQGYVSTRMTSRHTSTSHGVNETGDVDAPARQVTEKAALHILKSVTVKARALFTLLAKKTNGDKAEEGRGMEYSTLVDLAKRNFVASTENDLGALLVEFRDHGLVVRKGGRVKVMMGKEEMSRVLEGIKRI